MLKKPELLAPVGEMDSFYAAIENGANAVYVGGKHFSARQFAKNLDLEELKEIVEYAKLRNVKVYVTVNTLVKNEEMDELMSYIHDLSIIGVDAIIVQDLGVFRVVNKYFPNINVHASTQMSAHSIDDVKFLQDLGYKRVVLARELSLKEVKSIKKAVDIEIETFVHGALCVSYSGQCLMSSMIGGRSGNRGRCAQPCRLPYSLSEGGIDITNKDEEYLMSPKDIQTLDLIPDFINAGIDTFKVEGRMKSPEYIASVSRIYSKYIDMAMGKNDYKVARNDKDELLTVFNRGGFTEGYFTQEPGKSMMSTKSPKNMGLLVGEVISYSNMSNAQIKLKKDLNPGDGIGIMTQDGINTGAGISKKMKAGEILSIVIRGNISKGDKVYLSKDHELLKELSRSYSNNNRKSYVDIRLIARLDKAMEVELTHENGCVISLKGDKVIAARSAPISQEKLKEQISKFGNTPFKARNINIDCDSNIFIPISSINNLRRAASKELVAKILNNNSYSGKGYENYLNDRDLKEANVFTDKVFTGCVRNIDQLEACLDNLSHIYLELEYQEVSDIDRAIKLCQEKNVKLYIALPHIQRENDYNIYSDIMNYIESTDIDGYLIRNYGQIKRLARSNKEKIVDYTLNIMNNESIKAWENLGINTSTLSLELSEKEIENISGDCLEMVIYGYIPIMTTEQCLVGRYGNCDYKKGGLDSPYKLIDRKGEEYSLATNCKSCRMQILSSRPIALADRINQIKNLPIHKMRFEFTSERPEEIREIINWYTDEASQYSIGYNDRYFIHGVE